VRWAPLLEGAVGGDDDRPSFVAAGDEREEEVGGRALQWQVADLVDDQEVVALEAPELLLELVSVVRLLEPGDPFLGGREGDAVATLAGLHGERDREVCLAGPGRAEEADVCALLDPGELGEVQDERALRGGLRAPVEVLERLQGREAGVADARPRPRGVAGEDLGLEQALEELLVRPRLGAGPLRGVASANVLEGYSA